MQNFGQGVRLSIIMVLRGHATLEVDLPGTYYQPPARVTSDFSRKYHRVLLQLHHALRSERQAKLVSKLLYGKSHSIEGIAPTV